MDSISSLVGSTGPEVDALVDTGASFHLGTKVDSFLNAKSRLLDIALQLSSV